MSASTPSENAEVPNHRGFIAEQIRAAQARVRSTDILTAVVTCGILIIGYTLVFTIVDHWLIPGGFSPTARASLLLLLITGVAAIAWRSLLRPVSSSVTAIYAARMLDRNSQSRGALESLVDLQDNPGATSERVQRTLEGRAQAHLAASTPDDAVDRNHLVRMALLLFAVVVLTCVYSVFSPKPISLLRPLTLAGQTVATRTRITAVSPGDITIAAGENVEIRADISGVIPSQILVLYTTEDNEYLRAPVDMQPEDDDGRYQAVLTGEDVRGIRQATRYQVQAGDAFSDTYTIHVEVAATANVTQVSYEYPAYMKIPTTVSIAVGIEAWEGTKVLVQAVPTAEVSAATLELCPDQSFQTGVTSVPAEVAGRNIKAQWTLSLPDSGRVPKFYRVVVKDSQGRIDPSPSVHAIHIKPDLPPVAELLEPPDNQTVPSNATIPMVVRASDPDFLLRSVTLHYRINGELVEPGEKIFDYIDNQGFRKEWTGGHRLQLLPLDLKPGDRVQYWVEARDNKPPRGNRYDSPPQTLLIATAASRQELDKQLAHDEEIQERTLEELQRDKAMPEPEEQLEKMAADDREQQTPTKDAPTDDQASDERKTRIPILMVASRAGLSSQPKTIRWRMSRQRTTKPFRN